MGTTVSDRLVLWHRWLPPRTVEPPGERAAIAAWCKSLGTRFEVGGGSRLARIGGTVVAAFDPADSVDAIELSLDLLDEAEAAGLEISLGLALGPLSEHEGVWIGQAIERAQQLANRSRAGELVIGARVRKEVQEEFLFGRRVAGSWRGTTIDRKNPRRIESADAIALLAPATFPPIGATVVADMATHLGAGSSRTFVLRGPVGSGAKELVSMLAQESAHADVFRFGASPGGLVPLGSLRLALLRRFGSPEEVTRQVLSLGGTPVTADALGGVAAGELIPLAPLAMALAALLTPGDDGSAPWLLLSPLSLVDGATLAVLLEARALVDFVIFARLPTEAALPRPFANLDERVVEHVVPPLKTSDARVVAEEILGHATDADVARRVAVLGGDTMIGVVEAARTLIATGELVQGDGDGFVWRAGPRSGADMISTDALISERIDLLNTEARQVLEALCVAPDGSSRRLLEAVAARDAIGPATFDGSLERLVAEAFTEGENRPRPTSSLLRWRVLELIPSARSMELHRFVGEALAATASGHAPQLTELGYFLVEGGLEGEGAPLLGSVIEDLLAAGYRRAARHISGWMAEASADSGEATATRATPVPPRAEAHDEGPPSNERALDDFLVEPATARSERNPEAPKPPPPPPPSASKPLPPPSASLPLPARSRPAPPDSVTEEHEVIEVLELSVDEMEFVTPSSIPADGGGLVLDMEELSRPPEARTEDLALPAMRFDEAPVFDDPVFNAPAAHASDVPVPPPVDFSRPLSEPAAELDIELLAKLPEAADERVPEQVFAAPLPAEPEPEPEANPALEEPAFEEPAFEEPDSDATMLSDAAELMAAFRAHRMNPAEAKPIPPPARTNGSSNGNGSAAATPEEATTFADEAASAIRAGDFDGLESLIGRRIAEGGDFGAIARVRAVAQLARGEVGEARRGLQEARERGRDDPADQARFDVAMALLSLRSGQPLEGVRQGLRALASSRTLAGPRGEEAALKTIAACFRALGAHDHAQRIDG